MRFGRITLTMLGALVVATVPCMAVAEHAQIFEVRSGAGSHVQFVSDAPVDRFTGRTDKVQGTMSVVAADLSTVKGDLSVDATSFHTNIALRDEHLAGDGWLDAKKYPEIHFAIMGVQGASKLEANTQTALKVHGKLSLHGVTRPVTADTKVRYQPETKSLHIVGTFTVHLEDYQISIPKIVSLKVSPDIVVNIDLRASAR